MGVRSVYVFWPSGSRDGLPENCGQTVECREVDVFLLVDGLETLVDHVPGPVEHLQGDAENAAGSLAWGKGMSL